jgi:hypothetical protein
MPPDLRQAVRSARRGRGFRFPSPGPVRFPALQALFMTLIVATLLLTFQTRPAPAAPSGSGSPAFDWPCRGPVSIPFRPAAGAYGRGGHAGIDISVPLGTAVKAAADGRVAFSGGTPVGLCVTLDHGSGIRTTYVALAESSVRPGMTVRKGTVLGSSDGSQDRSSSLPHLHFGATLNGVPFDPLLLLNGELLDPSRDLFLGPWEDQKSMDAWKKAAMPRDKGLFQAVKDAFCSAGRAVRNAAGKLWEPVQKAAGGLWDGCKAFYRACIEPWAGGFIRAVGELCEAVVSSRFFQAALAALAAIALITVAVLGAVFTFGLSLSLAVAAIALASAAICAYATYYTCAAGDSFSFMQCFTGCLVVGGAVALGTIALGQSWALLSAGWKELGLLGFGKSFLAHGLADALATSAINAAAGRPFSLKAFVVSFLAGGLMGAGGKLFVTGLSQGMLEGLAAGAFAAGQPGLGISSLLDTASGLLREGGLSAVARYAAAGLGREMAAKLSYMAVCGSGAFLADFALHLCTGRSLSLGEAIASFGVGACMGGIGATAATLTPAGVLRNAIGVGRSMAADFARSYAKKTLTKGGKELFKAVRGGDGGSMGPEILPGTAGD